MSKIDDKCLSVLLSNWLKIIQLLVLQWYIATYTYTVANYRYNSKIKRSMMTLLKIVSCNNTHYRLIATKANLLLLVQYIDLLYGFEMMTL